MARADSAANWILAALANSWPELSFLKRVNYAHHGAVKPRSSHTRKLIVIPISHYCEKARWALDRAGLGYSEHRHLQLFHRIPVRLAKGNRTTPVLTTEEGSYCESTDILQYCDRFVARSSRLYPEHDKANIVSFERVLDTEFGVATRKLFYFSMRAAGRSYFLKLNNQGAPWWQRAALHLFYPLASRYAARHLSITAKSVEQAGVAIGETLARVTEQLRDGRPFLFGDRFTAADLTFAALSAPLSLPQNYGVRLPKRGSLPNVVAKLIEPYDCNPAIEFARRIYQEHRLVVATAKPQAVTS